MGILKRLVVYVQINNFFEYYKMDRKILILGITLTVVILFLSFRKEGYEEELKDWQTQTETLQNETIEIPPSFDIDSFIDNVRGVQEKQENSDDALEAFFEAAGELDILGTSSDDASEAYATNYRNQIQYTRLLIQISQEKNEERREELKEQLRETIQALHDGQAIASQGGEFSLDEISGFIPKRQIVKVHNVVNTFSDPEKVSYGPIVAQATGEPEHSTINQYRETVNVRVPKCEGNSCLTKDGEPGSSGYIIGSSDSDEAFGSCAVDCLNADKCSGFSVKEESTGAFYCRLTNNGFEKMQNITTGANEKLEQVYAIHEGFSENDWDSYLKNPLYFKMFNSAFDDNNCGDVPDVVECVENGRNSKTKIENDGIPRDCEGNWESIAESGLTGFLYDPNDPKKDARWENGCPRNIPNYGDSMSSGKICYNYDSASNGPPDRSTIPYYYKQFVPLKTGGSSLANGLPAINGGSCPDGLSIKQTCKEGNGGEEGSEIQVCQYSHGGWYDNDPDFAPVNCGADGPNQPGIINSSGEGENLILSACNYGNQTCPNYDGYSGGKIYGTRKVIGYDARGKPAKNGGKSCDALIREKINANDPYWTSYRIAGNDIVGECSQACFAVTANCGPGFEWNERTSICDPVAVVGPPPAPGPPPEYEPCTGKYCVDDGFIPVFDDGTGGGRPR
jgi:hypothetical protein